jgi:hypothetical protein
MGGDELGCWVTLTLNLIDCLLEDVASLRHPFRPFSPQLLLDKVSHGM